MNPMILQSTEPVTLVGGGVFSAQDLALARKIAPAVVAVDGGANRVVARGVDIAAVIGDMDSVSQATLSQLPLERVHEIGDQLTTDFDKALRSLQTPLVIGVGFSGGRVDHQLAAFHTLVARPEPPCILLYPDEIAFHCPPKIAFEADEGDVVSLFPMADVTGRSTGLDWPIDGLEFHPARFVGTSNRASGPVTLEMDHAGMLVVLKRRAIQQVAHALAALEPQERWRVP